MKLLLLAILATSPLTYACDSFLLADSAATFSAKNFNWQWGHGLVIVNKRNLAKQALAFGTPARWVSRFGSMTFNQVSRELPQGGMNEAGLNVEVLQLDTAVFPPEQGDARPTINELEWLQFQLDNYSTTAEVLAHLNDLRIQQFAVPVHYMVCDATNTCASIDPLKGKYVAHSAETMPFPALTNDTYEDSNAFAKTYDCSSIDNSVASLNRFAKLTCAMKMHQSATSNRVFAILNSTAVSSSGQESSMTQWSIVYNLREKTVGYFSHDSLVRKTVDLRAFDLSCRKPTQVVNVNAPRARFLDYTDQDEREILEASSVFTHLPAQAIDAIVKAVGSSVCTERE